MTTPRRVVITRAREGGETWRDRLTAVGIEVLLLPLIRFEAPPLMESFKAEEHDWLIFTSPQGVRAFHAALGGRSWSELPPVAVLADGTEAALKALGGEAALNPEALDGAELARGFAARVSPPARLLLPGAASRLAEPTAGLRAAGFEIRELPVYRTLPVPPAELPDAPFAPGDCVFFASPTALRAFRAAWPDQAIDCAAIGETSARACREAGLAPRVATKPNLASLCAAVGLHLPAVEAIDDSAEANDMLTNQSDEPKGA